MTAPLASTAVPATHLIRGGPHLVSNQREWLTSNEAALYLKVKPRTLLQWAREHKVPAHRLYGVERCVWRFLRPELDAMLGSSSADSADGRQH
jgi:excisionase family DNA binding protein